MTNRPLSKYTSRVRAGDDVSRRSPTVTKVFMILRMFAHSIIGILFVCGAASLAIARETPATVAPVANAAIELFDATLTLPGGWTVDRRGAFSVIRPPEPGFEIRVVQLSAADAAKAATGAWRVTHPGFHDPLKSSTPRGAVGGWDDDVLFNYDTPASESRISLAAAYRKGDRWTVFTVGGSQSVVDRRRPELGQLIGSIAPSGHTAENLAGRTPHPLDQQRIAMLRSFVVDSMHALRIPGAALAVIEGDRIALEQGLGVRNVAKRTPVDVHTRFMIASNTKGMTTLLMATLVDDGKMRWDQPVTTLFPALKLADPEATRKLEVRHLVCACTGLPRADYETYFVDPTAPAQLAFDQLATLKPTTEFGSVYQYSNTLAAVAGFIAGHVAFPAMEPSLGYDRAMRERVWQPLGMAETSFDDPRTIRGNVAEPYADRLEGGIGLAPQELNATLLPFRPTGSAWTSIHDMALYVRNEVTEGKLADGRQWVGKENLLARRARGVSMGKDSWYGMGIETNLVGGIGTVFHGGAVNGYKSDWIVVPDARIGAVLLTNGENGYALVTAFRRKLMELLYDAKPEADAAVAAEAKRIDSDLASMRKSINRSVPRNLSLGLLYSNPLLGRIAIQRRDGNVRFDFGPWATDMGVKRDSNALGGFDLVSIAPSEIGDLSFVPGREGDTRTLTLRDSQHVYVYREEQRPAHGRGRGGPSTAR